MLIGEQDWYDRENISIVKLISQSILILLWDLDFLNLVLDLGFLSMILVLAEFLCWPTVMLRRIIPGFCVSITSFSIWRVIFIFYDVKELSR